MNIEVWHNAKAEVEKIILLRPSCSTAPFPTCSSQAPRGSVAQVTQMAGMKGLIASPTGEAIEFPITKSMKEGLSPLEYFITTHGSRKGLSDNRAQHREGGLSHAPPLRCRAGRRRRRGGLRHQRGSRGHPRVGIRHRHLLGTKHHRPLSCGRCRDRRQGRIQERPIYQSRRREADRRRECPERLRALSRCLQVRARHLRQVLRRRPRHHEAGRLGRGGRHGGGNRPSASRAPSTRCATFHAGGAASVGRRHHAGSAPRRGDLRAPHLRATRRSSRASRAKSSR